MQNIESIKEFGGYLNRYRHDSDSCHCRMTFSAYLPPQAEQAPVPALYWLSGLTCTDDNFRVKAGAQRYAAEHGVALIVPDTSPRGDDVPDAADRYDLGQGAGFYVNATRQPWSKHYHMYDYIVSELPALVEARLPLIAGLKSISGHSMGGHGALVCALKNPGSYRSVSAFSPICNPVQCGWGEGCFGAYLGDDKTTWEAWDATCLIQAGYAPPPLLIDQGSADEFLA
jgi:S-formylglutathione hydrolase